MKNKTEIEIEIETEKKPYQQLVGCLLHFSDIKRPDVSYSAVYLSRFSQEKTISLWNTVKHVLIYLKGTKHTGI